MNGIQQDDNFEGYCPQHLNNTAMINKHSGMWVVLLAFAAVLVTFCIVQFRATREIEKSAVNIDKTFTAYISKNDQRMTEVLYRVTNVEKNSDEHRLRLRELEREFERLEHAQDTKPERGK